MLLVLMCIYHALYHTRSDWVLVLMTWTGCHMAGMLGVKWLVCGYIDAAERTGRWSWLYGDDDSDNVTIAEGEKESVKSTHSLPAEFSSKTQRQDIVLVTKFGEEVIGTVVLRVVPVALTRRAALAAYASSDEPDNTPRMVPSQFKPFIRAWTVKQFYRSHGVGSTLIKDAVLMCIDRRWDVPEFATEHAHSLRVLPPAFNMHMDYLSLVAQVHVAWHIRQGYLLAREDMMQQRETIQEDRERLLTSRENTHDIMLRAAARKLKQLKEKELFLDGRVRELNKSKAALEELWAEERRKRKENVTQTAAHLDRPIN